VVSPADAFRHTDHPVCVSLRSPHPPLLCEEGNIGRQTISRILYLNLAAEAAIIRLGLRSP